MKKDFKSIIKSNLTKRMISGVIALLVLSPNIATGTEKVIDNDRIKKRISYTQFDHNKSSNSDNSEETIQIDKEKEEIIKNNHQNIYIKYDGDVYECLDRSFQTLYSKYNFDSYEEEETVDSYDWYSDEIIESILERYNISMFEFQVIVSVVAHEAAAESYDDAYRVINTILNRIHSYNWINYVKSVTGLDGKNPYAQAKCPGQFVVYNSSSGYDYNSTYGTDAFKATVDCMNTGISIHNNLSFKSNNTQINGERFTSKGNVYHNQMTESDTIEGVEIVDTIWDIVNSDMIHEMALSIEKENSSVKKTIVKRLRLYPY